MHRTSVPDPRFASTLAAVLLIALMLPAPGGATTGMPVFAVSNDAHDHTFDDILTTSGLPRIPGLPFDLRLEAPPGIAPTANGVEPPTPGRTGGLELWDARYTGPANGNTHAWAMDVDPAGLRVYVAASSMGIDTWQKYATLAYDALTGLPLWEAWYQGDTGSSEVPTAIAAAPDGSRVFVTGYGANPYWDYTTVAYDAATGLELWVSHYAYATFTDQPTAITVSPDSTRVYVTGSSERGVTSFDYATVAYDAETGEELWAARYSASSWDMATAIGISPDGERIFVTGLSAGPNDFDYVTIAYDALTGAELWVARHDGPAGGRDLAWDLAVAPDGNRVYVTGEVTAPGRVHYATLAYDAETGDTLWVAHFDSPIGALDVAEHIAVSPDGATVVVTGWSQGPNLQDYATVAYDAETGLERWQARYNGPADWQDIPRGIAMGHDGDRVYVTGQSQGGASQYDLLTIAYRLEDGAEMWLGRYDYDWRHDYGWAIAADPLNLRVYSAGFSRDATQTFGATTVAHVLDEATILSGLGLPPPP